jgi:hypothetical protein
LFAQNGVILSNLSVAPGTVTFEVRWDRDSVPAVWSDTVWVFVDYNDRGVMRRLALTGATLTAPSWADASISPPNDQGAWVVGNARGAGSFSTTVALFSEQAASAGACAYASNYPPIAEYDLPTRNIKFTGASPYDLTLNTGAISVKEAYTLAGDQALVSFTDKTGAPGSFACLPPAPQTLRASATTCCEGSAGVTLALAGTQAGAMYRLYKGSEPLSGVTGHTASGGAATFTGSFTAGTYTVQTEAGLFCAATVTTALTITELAKPAAFTVNGTTPACGTVTLSVDPVSGVSFYWDGASTAATGKEYTASTTAQVVAVNAAGCTEASSRPITVNPLPTAPNTDITTNECNRLVLTASDGGLNVAGYRWDGAEPNSTTKTFAFDAQGYVQAVSPEGCLGPEALYEAHPDMGSLEGAVPNACVCASGLTQCQSHNDPVGVCMRGTCYYAIWETSSTGHCRYGGSPINSSHCAAAYQYTGLSSLAAYTGITRPSGGVRYNWTECRYGAWGSAHSPDRGGTAAYFACYK